MKLFDKILLYFAVFFAIGNVIGIAKNLTDNNNHNAYHCFLYLLINLASIQILIIKKK